VFKEIDFFFVFSDSSFVPTIGNFCKKAGTFSKRERIIIISLLLLMAFVL